MLEFVLINKGESNRNLFEMFTGKNLRMTPKNILRADLIKKDLTRCAKNRRVCGG